MTDYEGNCLSVCINPLRVESFYMTVIFTYFPLLCFQHPLACRLMNKSNTGYISMCLSIAQCQSDPVCQGQLQRAGYVQGWVDEHGVFHPDTQNISEFIWFHMISFAKLDLRASLPPSLRWGHCSSSFPTRAFLRPGGGRLRARTRGGAREQARGWAWLSPSEKVWQSLVPGTRWHKWEIARASTYGQVWPPNQLSTFQILSHPTTTGHTWPHPAFEAARARNHMRDVVVLALDRITLRNHVSSDFVSQKRWVSEAVRLDTFTHV